MCGRYSLKTKIRGVMAYYKAYGDFSFEGNDNITPGVPIPALVWSTKRRRREMHALKWGFVPEWSKERNSKFINARSESVFEKPSFSNAVASRRCIIPADGYYEWHPKNKERYYVEPLEDEPLSMAGIWEPWKDPVTGAMSLTCAIVTQDSEGHMSADPVHHRMPLLLKEGEWDRWLKPESSLDDVRLVLNAPRMTKLNIERFEPNKLANFDSVIKI